MNIGLLKKQMFDLEDQVRIKINLLTTKKASKITGICQTQLSSFIHGNRTFSYKRLLDIAEKIF